MRSSVARKRRKQLTSSLTQERLKELLEYSPGTGVFRWRLPGPSGEPAGRRAGTNHGGYRSIRIDGVRHYEHRLAWLYVYGEHPAGDIDHVNANRADNRISNLRDCSHAENLWNAVRRKASRFTGAFRSGDKWFAKITVNGRHYFLGTYDTREEAAAAYRCADRLLRGELTRARPRRAA
jgi:HNH endonuclease